jgi:hypothetical protein
VSIRITPHNTTCSSFAISPCNFALSTLNVQIALIMDESHEIFNERKCPREEGRMLPNFLLDISGRKNSMIFSLSGTPGKTEQELLMQIELVRGTSDRRAHEPFLRKEDGWEQQLKSYARGCVSYVDGSKDLSTFPEDLGVHEIDCKMSFEQWATFSHSQVRKIEGLGCGPPLDANDDPVAKYFEKLGTNHVHPELMNTAREMQLASTVCWGGEVNGLLAIIRKKGTCSLEEVRVFLFRILVHLFLPLRLC